jgi:ribosomal protein S7
MAQKKLQILNNNIIELKNKLVNLLLRNGNKHKSEKLLLLSIKNFQKNNDTNHKELFQEAILNVMPTFLLKQIKALKRKRRKERQIPFVPKKNLRLFFAFKIIVSDIKKKKHSKKFYKNITQELSFSAEQISQAYKKQNDIQKNAMLNKKNFFFKWF